MKLFLEETQVQEEKIPGTPSKNDLKNMQKKYKKLNRKHKNARSYLERDGGAANVNGGSINNAFFNRAMGNSVSASDFEPSSTGFASDGASAGDACGGCGEAYLRQALDSLESLEEDISTINTVKNTCSYDDVDDKDDIWGK